MWIKRINNIPYLVLAIWIIMFLCTHAPNLEYDTHGYIHFDVRRPPLYPIFIWLFNWAGYYQFQLLIWIQGCLLCAALMYARHWLRTNLKLSDFSIFLVCVAVVFTISLHFQITYVQSEGITFPLFIVIFFLLIECFNKFNLRKICYLAALTSVLILTRLQFMYFYVIFGILCLWYLWQHVPIKLCGIAIALLFGSMLTTIFIDHGYHYVKHGIFGGAPYGGILLLVQTLYLADNDAARYFKDPIEKDYVQSLIDRRNAQHLNSNILLLKHFKPTFYENAYHVYAKKYIKLQQLIENILSYKTSAFTADAMAMRINKIFFIHNIKTNLLFLLWKFIKCMEGVPVFTFFCIALITSMVKIARNKIRAPDLSLIFIFIVTIVTILNAAIIAICNPYLPGYFCYSQFIFYCVAAFLSTTNFQYASNPWSTPDCTDTST